MRSLGNGSWLLCLCIAPYVHVPHWVHDLIQLTQVAHVGFTSFDEVFQPTAPEERARRSQVGREPRRAIIQDYAAQGGQDVRFARQGHPRWHQGLHVSHLYDIIQGFEARHGYLRWGVVFFPFLNVLWDLALTFPRTLLIDMCFDKC